MTDDNKKKEVASSIPETPETPVSNVRTYFTKEINDQIAEMDLKRMESILKDLPDSPYWIAILKYTQARMPMLDAQLRITDPYKEPYKVVFAQGCMAGICDLETYIIDLISPNPSDTQTPESGAGNSIGNG